MTGQHTRIRALEAEVERLRQVCAGLMTGRMSFIYYEGDVMPDDPDAPAGWVAFDHRTGMRHTGLTSLEEAQAIIGADDDDTEFVASHGL